MASFTSVPRVGVVGSCNADFVIRCHHLPRPGETIVGGDVVRLPGGKGANQAVAAARLGANVSLIAAVGNDDTGEWLLSELATYGVDLSGVRRSPRSTGTAFIVVDDHAQNEIIVSRGANADLNLANVNLEPFDVVLAQMEVAPSVIDEAARRSRSFILNVAPALVVEPDTLARCDLVIANEVEAESFALSSIADCIVTLGARGAVHYRRGREVTRAVAPALEPVDTVGAGDVFCAAYAFQFARRVNEDDALRFAVAAGSLATLAVGAQGALPTYSEVAQCLARV